MSGSVLSASLLVIDDDPPHRGALSSLLKNRQVEPLFASAQGGTALALLSQSPAMSVLIHLVPPYERGLSMICRIRQGYPDTKILAVASSGPVPPIDLLAPWNCLETARRLGADQVLLQPFGPEGLAEAIDDLLGAVR